MKTTKISVEVDMAELGVTVCEGPGKAETNNNISGNNEGNPYRSMLERIAEALGHNTAELINNFSLTLIRS